MLPYLKAYFRRAAAYAAILKPKDALKDFRTCLKLDPNNKDVKLKLAECQKVVRQLDFFAAIEVGDEPSAAEGLDIDSMAVEADYDGVKLGKEMTQEFIDDMTERFKIGKKLPRKYVYQIILAVKSIVYAESTLREMTIPDGVTLTVCGDTHGMLQSPWLNATRQLTRRRPVFRSHGAFPHKWQPRRQALVPVQRRFCGPGLLVYGNCPAVVCQQVAASRRLLPQPRKPRD